MRRSLGLFMALMVFFVINVQADIESKQIQIDSSAAGNEPAFLVLEDLGNALTLEFQLPALTCEEFTIDGETFQGLSIKGGDLYGEIGQAGIPCITRLVAIPNDVAVKVGNIAKMEKGLSGYHILPIQEDRAERFSIDRNYYQGLDRAECPEIAIGEPAILRDLRVVPVTFYPVSYDPARGEMKVAERMTVELEFSGRDDRNAVATKRNLIPESFDRLYRDTVINYRSGDVNVGPGTYLMICNTSSSITSRVASLLNWRRRQGYNVILETTDTGSTSTVKSIIQGHYNSANPPLEFVTLVGDANGSYDIPTYNESHTSYSGEGDHYYTKLDGSDVLSDVHLGRISIQSTSDLDVIINKIVNYESAPPTGDTSWYRSASLTADPSNSGETCIFVSEWLKSELLDHGYNNVQTIYGGNFVSQMLTDLNAGLTAFGYRGWWGMSNFSVNVINSASNGSKLPFAVIVTCDTGSFKSDSNCQSEAFLRAPNGGAIGSVGTATTGTHTRYNNCYYHGAWEGVINGSDHRLGVAHTRGKLELYNNYNLSQPNTVDTWCVWNNLMGDPATDMWTGVPVSMSVSYPSQVAVGANSVEISVSAGGAVEGALVAVYKSGQISSSGYTDFNGNVNLPISGYTSGSLLVTVTKHNHRPHLGSLSLGSVGQYVSFSDMTIDDDNSGGSSGNSNNEANPGESLELTVALHNYGSSSAGSVTGTIASTDPFVTITDNSEGFGTIASGATVWSSGDFDITLADNTPDGHVVELSLNADNGSSDWTSLIELPVYSAAFDYSSFSWGGSGSTLDPGESGSLAIYITNNGSRSGSSISGSLQTTSPWVTVTDASGGYGDMNSGSTSSGGFALNISSDCFEGHLAPFLLTLTYSDGQKDLVEFNLPVGSASSNDPVGPDAYGYYAFDNLDSGNPYAPVYNWIEIDPTRGGSGTSLGSNDFGWEQDDRVIRTLPFDFTFYGETYNQISICSNGFIAMGSCDMVMYRNWSIPSAGSPNAMIAGFWDNLAQSGSNKIYYYNDTENDRYIVQWSRVRNYQDDNLSATQVFEIIFYDPAVYETVTGDGIIDVQYDTVGNTDSENGYATVGIQNTDGTDGVLYHYWNQAAPGAGSLTSGRIIRYMPVGDMHLGTLQGDVTNADNGGAGISDVTIRLLETDQTLITNTSGHYAGGVSEGTYNVRAEHESFESVTINNVSITEDHVTTRNFSLQDILGPYIENVTVLPYTSDTSGPYVIDFWVTDYSNIDDLDLFYKANNGGEHSASLTLIDADTGHYRAEIPGYQTNIKINYWIQATDSADNVSRNPEGGDSFYEFWILGEVLALDDDMQTDQGWSVNTDASTGAWTRVDPIGVFDGSTTVSPEDDASIDGTLCWITGNDEDGNQGTDDIDNGTTTLTSPVYDLTTVTNAQLSYRRWYSNDTGSSPGQDTWRVEITANGSDWETLENTTSSDRSWSLHSFLIDDYIELTATVQIRFIASDLGDGSVVEAGVDELAINAFLLPTLTGAPGTVAPAQLTLLPNMPNPFNPETQIRFGLPTAEKVNLSVYDVNGRMVRELISNRSMAKGYHSSTWNGLNENGHQVSSGIYFYVLRTDSQNLSGKMTLVK
ncbi:MAG: T9SS type A sorting domain-containing protein [bacterium]|nr:T9SS type A sorting domain-containing protein [bacterium]